MLESSRKQLPPSIEKLEKPSMKCVPVAKMVGDHWTAAAAAKLLQSCPTLCDPIDGLLSGSPIPGILQARTLEWVAISFSNAWKWKVKVKSFSHVRLLATPRTAAYQAPPPKGFTRQEYWREVPLSSPDIGLENAYQDFKEVWSWRPPRHYSGKDGREGILFPLQRKRNG